MALVEDENVLWRRVAALRGIQAPKRGERPHISGDRFLVRLGDRFLVRVAHAQEKARAQRLTATTVATVHFDRDAPASFTPIGWRRALIQMEAARRARAQLERRST